MKLRIRGDSVRLRLTQGELRTLVDRGRVEERTRLGPLPEDSLAYGIELSDSQSSILCTWARSRLVVVLPTKRARDWATGAELGLEESLAVADGAMLRIVVERISPA